MAMTSVLARDQAEWNPVSRTQIGYSRSGHYIRRSRENPKSVSRAKSKKLEREPRISLRNPRKLDCYAQNRFPLLLIAL
jgi:hypothetical protein